MVVRKRRDVIDRARGKVVISERLDVAECARGKGLFGRDVMLQTVQGGCGRSGET